jgi:hypothetical protein
LNYFILLAIVASAALVFIAAALFVDLVRFFELRRRHGLPFPADIEAAFEKERRGRLYPQVGWAAMVMVLCMAFGLMGLAIYVLTL